MKYLNFEKISKTALSLKDNFFRIYQRDPYLNEQFNKYLKFEDFLFCYEMIDNGFKPSFIQKNKIEELISVKISEKKYSFEQINSIQSISEDIKRLNFFESLDEKYSIQDKKIILNYLNTEERKKDFQQYIKNYFKELKSYYHSGLDMHGDFCKKSLNQNIIKKIQIKRIVYLVDMLSQNGLFSVEDIKNTTDIFLKFTNYAKRKTKEIYIDDSFNRIGLLHVINYLEKIQKQEINFLNKSEEKTQILNKLKNLKEKNKFIIEKEDIFTINEKYSLTELPEEAKTILQVIKDFSNKCEDKEVKNFIDTNLSIILKKYFSVDVEYRDTLKNIQGLNAQELMIKSLEGVETIIYANKKENNVNALTDLSVETRKYRIV